MERKSGDPLRIACLPLMDVNMPEGSQCYVAGWGATRTHASTSATPLYTTLEITDAKKCQRSFGFGRGVLESERLFCAGTPSTSRVLTDTCTGDSGGGMFCKKPQGTGLDSLWFLYGIVSFGYEGIKDCFFVPNFNYFFFLLSPECAPRDRMPAVYTDVSHFTTWIYDTINSLMLIPKTTTTTTMAPVTIDWRRWHWYFDRLKNWY